MYRLTETLLSGSGITPASHPVLVSLLERAAAPPGLRPAQFASSADYQRTAKRWMRDWQRVELAFAEFSEVEATDADLALVMAARGGAAIFQGSTENGAKIVNLSLRQEIARLVNGAANAARAEVKTS